jgi:hypothetical protein
MVIVKLELHKARNTPAMTFYLVNVGDLLIELDKAEKQGLVRFLYRTGYNNTHWYEYYEILKDIDAIVRVRVSNRGNIYYYFIYTWKELAVSEDEQKIVKMMLRESDKNVGLD